MVGSKQSGCVSEGRILENSRLNIVIHSLARLERNRDCEATSLVFTEEHIGTLSSSRHVRLKVVQDVVTGMDQISLTGHQPLLCVTFLTQ